MNLNHLTYYFRYATTDFPIKAFMLGLHSMLFANMGAYQYGNFVLILAHASVIRVFFGFEIHRLYEIYGARSKFKQIFSDLIQSIFYLCSSVMVVLTLFFYTTISQVYENLFYIFVLSFSLGIRELSLSALRANNSFSDYMTHEIIYVIPLILLMGLMLTGHVPDIQQVALAFMVSGFTSIPVCYFKNIIYWKKIRYFNIKPSLHLMVPYTLKALGAQSYQGLDKIILSFFVTEDFLGLIGIVQRLLSPIKVFGNSLWRSIRKKIITELRVTGRVTTDEMRNSVVFLTLFSVVNVTLVVFYFYLISQFEFQLLITIIMYAMFFQIRFFSQKNDIQILVQKLNNRILIEPVVMLGSLALIPLFPEFLWWPAAAGCCGLLLSYKLALHGRHF